MSVSHKNTGVRCFSIGEQQSGKAHRGNACVNSPVSTNDQRVVEYEADTACCAPHSRSVDFPKLKERLLNVVQTTHTAVNRKSMRVLRRASSLEGLEKIQENVQQPWCSSDQVRVLPVQVAVPTA